MAELGTPTISEAFLKLRVRSVPKSTEQAADAVPIVSTVQQDGGEVLVASTDQQETVADTAPKTRKRKSATVVD